MLNDRMRWIWYNDVTPVICTGMLRDFKSVMIGYKQNTTMVYSVPRVVVEQLGTAVRGFQVQPMDSI